MTEPYKIRTKPITTTRKVPEEQQVRDTFQTPNYAINLLLPYIPKDIPFVWEPACGGGKISRKLSDAGYTVFESDIKHVNEANTFNFITEWKNDLPEQILIITNPPFSIKDLFVERCFEYGKPFALLINADYSQQTINWIERGCEKIIPTARISYITPNITIRVNAGEGTDYSRIEDIPTNLMYKYSSAQFHSMWLTYGFNLGRTETFVNLSVNDRRNNV